MRLITLFLLLILSTDLHAESLNPVFVGPVYEPTITSIEVSRLFDEDYVAEIKLLVNLADKEAKIGECIRGYVVKQSRSYAKIAQANLYDLIHNFDRITSKIQGKIASDDHVPFDEKIAALAQVQCEAYYRMGVLK